MNKKVIAKGTIHENVSLNLFDKDGKLKTSRKLSNIVTNVGKAAMASRFGDTATTEFTYIALGTGTTAAAATDTALVAEIDELGGERAEGVFTQKTTTTTDDTMSLSKTFTFTGSKAITEAGVLNAASAGTLANRSVFSAINVVSTDNLQVTIDFSFA